MTTVNQKFAQVQPFSLYGSGAVLGATFIILTSFLDIEGNQLTMASFGSLGWGTLEPGNGSLEEQISFTGITVNANGTTTLTGVSSVGFIYPYTSTSGLAKTHAGSTAFIISNTSGFYSELASTSDDETITGLYNFPTGVNNPTIGTAYVAPTLALQIPTKQYVDSVAVAGAPQATTSQVGIVLLSSSQVGTPIVVSTNDTRVSPVSLATVTAGEVAALPGNNTDVAVGAGNKYVTQTGLQHNAEKYAVDTGSSTAYVITLSPAPTSLTDGMVVYAKLVNANTTTTPTLNVNGLGAKTIVFPGGAPLANGSIGTNFCGSFLYNFSSSWWVLESNPTPTAVIANPSRVATTVYQNTSNSLIMVIVSVALLNTQTNTPGQYGKAVLFSDAASTPTTEICEVQNTTNATGTFVTVTETLTTIVPPNYYYKVVDQSSGGIATIVKWTEITFSR